MRKPHNPLDDYLAVTIPRGHEGPRRVPVRPAAAQLRAAGGSPGAVLQLWTYADREGAPAYPGTSVLLSYN